MATIELSGIGITGARGKIGESVFTRNKGGNAVRAYVIPVNTITPARTAIRAMFSIAQSDWATLSQSEVATWSLLATRIMKINKVSNKYRTTGRTLFLEATLNALTAGQFPINEPDLQAVSQPIRAVNFLVLSNLSVFIRTVFLDNTSVVPLNHCVVIQCSPSCSPGINYPKNFFRIIRVFTAGENVSTVDLFLDYVAVFGVPVVGQKIFVRVSQFNQLLGLKCAVLLNSALVV